MQNDILKPLVLLQVVFVSLVDPGCFRDIHNFVQQISNGTGQVDVLSLGVMEQGDAHSQFDAWGSSQSERHARQVQEGQDPADRCLIALLLTFSCPKPTWNLPAYCLEIITLVHSIILNTNVRIEGRG